MATISSNPTSGLISSPGLGSGLDVNKLVSKLVAAEKKPAQSQIDNQRVIVKAQTTAVGSLKSVLAGLQNSLSSLADGSAFGRRTAVSSDKDLFTASVGASAGPGSHSIEILQMAAAQRVTSSAYAEDAAIGTGTLTVAVGSKSMDIHIHIDASNNTLAGIRDAINGAKDNPGVSASIVHAEDGDHLVFTAAKTGLDNAFSISASGGDGNLSALTWDAGSGSGSLSQQAAAADASIKIDGFEAHSANNTFDGVVEGITINVAGMATEPGQVETLTVARDTDAMQNLVKNFVNAYNKFVDGAKQLASYDPKTNTAGPLLGDATLRGIRMQLSSVLSSTAGGGSAGLQTFADIGIQLQGDGTLKLDNSKLGEALKAQPAQVASLFGGDFGYGSRLDNLLDGYLGAGGLLSTRSDSLDARSKQLDDQQSRLDTRMQSVQDRYMKQFTALDVTMTQMTQTSNFLATQLDMLASIYKPDKN